MDRAASVALESRNNMKMEMVDRLTANSTLIYADCKPCRLQSLCQSRGYFGSRPENSREILVGQVNDRRNMSLGNYQRVARRNRTRVQEDNCSAVFSNNFCRNFRFLNKINGFVILKVYLLIFHRTYTVIISEYHAEIGNIRKTNTI